MNSYDMGDPEPGFEVIVLLDCTAPGDPFDSDSDEWHRTVAGTEWKGYKNGTGVYLEWAELSRRWGPLKPK